MSDGPDEMRKKRTRSVPPRRGLPQAVGDRRSGFLARHAERHTVHRRRDRGRRPGGIRPRHICHRARTQQRRHSQRDPGRGDGHRARVLDRRGHGSFDGRPRRVTGTNARDRRSAHQRRAGFHQSHRGKELALRAAVETSLLALRSAPQINAEILGIDSEVGTIEVGKLADLAGWATDPAEDPKTFGDPSRQSSSSRPVASSRTPADRTQTVAVRGRRAAGRRPSRGPDRDLTIGHRRAGWARRRPPASVGGHRVRLGAGTSMTPPDRRPTTPSA